MDRKHRLLKHAPFAVGGLLVLVLVLGLIWFIRDFMSHKNQKTERVVQNITVIRPPPPPPPPDEPPPPPPPEKIEQQVPQNEPDPSHDDAPPPAEQLGLDAEGAAGDDAFGLAARKGGSDLVGTGGAVFAWYTNKLKDTILERLSADPHLRGKKYNLQIRIWLDAEGRIKNMQIVGSSGEKEIDKAISTDVSGIGRFGEAPPLELPQPITWQLNSHT